MNVFGRASFAFGEGGEVYTEIGYSKETIFSNTPSGVSGGWGYLAARSTPTAVPVRPSCMQVIRTTPLPTAARLRYSAWDVGRA